MPLGIAACCDKVAACLRSPTAISRCIAADASALPDVPLVTSGCTECTSTGAPVCAAEVGRGSAAEARTSPTAPQAPLRHHGWAVGVNLAACRSSNSPLLPLLDWLSGFAAKLVTRLPTATDKRRSTSTLARPVQVHGTRLWSCSDGMPSLVSPTCAAGCVKRASRWKSTGDAGHCTCEAVWLPSWVWLRIDKSN